MSNLDMCFVCREPADYKCLRCVETVCQLHAPTEEHSCGQNDEPVTDECDLGGGD